MRAAVLLTSILLGLALVGPTSGALAAERVTIATGGYGNVAFLPYEVARALRYFEEQDLQADFQYLKSGSHAAAAVIGGSADFGGANFDHVVKANAQGKRLTLIATFVEVPAFQLLVHTRLRETVRDLRDLKGRPIGVTGLGSGTHIVLVHILRRAGLASEEINAVPVGFEALVAALDNGRVDALLTGGAPALKVVETGRAFVLADLSTRARAEAFFGGPYVDAGVFTRAELIAERPDLCRKVVLAVVKANQWIASHTPAEIVAVLPVEMVQDRALYTRTLEALHDAYSKDGRVDPRAVATVVSAHRSFGTIAAGQALDEGSLYDNRFVEEALGARR